MERSMEKESTNGRMATFILGHSSRISDRVEVSTLGVMEELTRVNGSRRG